MRAELHADGGEAAASDEFFRSRPFLSAEGATHTLEVGPVRLPVIVREIEGSGGTCDAISPYGYPGATVAEGNEPADPGAVDWSAAGLVSLFVRDRVGDPPAFRGGTERSRLQVHDPGAERRVRSRFAEQIRRNQREGWTVEAIAGPDTSEHQRAAFLSLYTETMTRAEAAPRYFYEWGYFARVLAFSRSWVLLARSETGGVGAGAIAAVSDGILHYYLGGTGDEFLGASPFKNVVVAMMDLADELGLPLNLGGGVTAGDGLEDFKRGFANAERPFVTHEIVCDTEAYERLAAGREAGGYFPAYRAE